MNPPRRMWIALFAFALASALAAFFFQSQERRRSERTAIPVESRRSAPAYPAVLILPPSLVEIHEPRRSPQSSLTVASWNINFGNRDLKTVVHQLRQLNADIICLQETTPESESYLQTKMKAQYEHSMTFGNQDKWAAERFMILCRKPLDQINFVSPARNFFGHVTATISIDGVATTIIVAHLAPFSARGARNLSELMLAMGQSEIDHQHEINAILRDVPPDAPCVVVGDLNSLSSFVAPTALREHGLVDTFLELHPNADLDHRTWRWPIGSLGELDLRIDYVFHSAHFEGFKAEVVESRCSDHRLIVAELNWKNRPKTAARPSSAITPP